MHSWVLTRDEMVHIVTAKVWPKWFQLHCFQVQTCEMSHDLWMFHLKCRQDPGNSGKVLIYSDRQFEAVSAEALVYCIYKKKIIDYRLKTSKALKAPAMSLCFGTWFKGSRGSKSSGSLWCVLVAQFAQNIKPSEWHVARHRSSQHYEFYVLCQFYPKKEKKTLEKH